MDISIVCSEKQAGDDSRTHLRCKKKREKRYDKPDGLWAIKNRVSIDERSTIVETT